MSIVGVRRDRITQENLTLKAMTTDKQKLSIILDKIDHDYLSERAEEIGRTKSSLGAYIIREWIKEDKEKKEEDKKKLI